MEPFAWPVVVVVLGFAVLIGFRKSLSKILAGIIKVIEGIKLHKAPGGLEFERIPQQQIEEPKTDSRLVPTTSVKEANEIIDPVLGPKIQILQEELNHISKDPAQREKALLRAVALWQVNHENERTARYIFGSQLDILLLLNTRPNGEPLENIRAIYDRAVENSPAFYKSYPFESYLTFLENAHCVAREGDRLMITPRGKGFLHYLVAIGDTVRRAN